MEELVFGKWPHYKLASLNIFTLLDHPIGLEHLMSALAGNAIIIYIMQQWLLDTAAPKTALKWLDILDRHKELSIMSPWLTLWLKAAQWNKFIFNSTILGLAVFLLHSREKRSAKYIWTSDHLISSYIRTDASLHITVDDITRKVLPTKSSKSIYSWNYETRAQGMGTYISNYFISCANRTWKNLAHVK